MVPIHSGVVQSDSSSNRPTISGKGLNKEELKMAAELKMVEELQALRQEVITSYLSNQRNNRNSTGSGGHKRKQETDSGCLVNNASIMVNPFYRLGQASPCCVTLKKPRRSLEEMQQRLLASHLRSMFRNFYRDTSTGIRGISVGKGPTCIEFDTEGALFAVAESDGQLRVFDFDESLAKFSRATDDSRTIGQQPVATVATRRTISCVSWSKLRPDELAIAFAFYPQIQLYDLATDCRTPKRSLLPPSIASNSGITSIAHWEHRKTTEHAEKSIVKSENSLSLKKGLPTIPNACTSRGFINESIVAGSQSGFVACWDMSNRNTSSGCAPKWVIAADPLKSYPHSSGVIGLFPLLVGRQLLTITAAGVFAVWDMVMLKVPAFGATSAPTCVWRVSLAESLSTHLVQRQLIKVSALPRNVDRCFACYSESSLHVIDLDDGCQILQSRNLAAARLQKEVPDTQFLQKQVSDESLVAECRSAAVACAVFPDCWDGEVAIVSEKEHLHFLDIKTCGRSNQLTKKNVTISHPNNCSPREEFTLEAIKSTEHYNCTLLAFVVSAIPGEDTIMLSHDLSRGFTVNSPAASPKEFMIMLDWTQVNFDGDLVQSNMIEQGKSCQSSQIISCQKVSSCCFLLNAPYEGPRVVLGIPRVRIRTNELQSDLSSLRRERNAPTFSGQNSRNESDPLILTQQTFQNYSPFGWWPKLCTVKNLDGRVNAEEVDLDVPIDCRHFTVLVAHPYLPYVVGGSTENSLEVLGFS